MMPTTEQLTVEHYARAELERAILAGLHALGADAAPKPEDLAAVDEFHMSGRAATLELAAALNLTPETRVLDIGAGIGGTARHLAAAYGCRGTGVDLTPDYVGTARQLTRLLGLDDRVAFEVASAVDLPFADGDFDVATLLHVGMNIADKRRLATEAHRVLAPGGLFVVYDAMRTGPGESPSRCRGRAHPRPLSSPRRRTTGRPWRLSGSGSRASAGAPTSRLPPSGRCASGCRRAARHRSASIS